jgi:hypothetical protein
LSTIGDNDFLVSEAIEELEKAIALKPDYDGAIAYLSLNVSGRVDLEIDDAARASALKAAGQWVQCALEVKNGRRKATLRQTLRS